jgi:hypothetical protein
VRALPGMSADDAAALVQLSLGDLVRGLHDPAALVAQVAAAQRALSPDVNGADARALDARGAPDLAPSHVPPASTPEQPSTPVSLFTPLASPPRTAVAREVARRAGRHRGQAPAAHGRRHASRAWPAVADLTVLMMSLPKLERALCIPRRSARILRTRSLSCSWRLMTTSSPLRPRPHLRPRPRRSRLRRRRPRRRALARSQC